MAIQEDIDRLNELGRKWHERNRKDTYGCKELEKKIFESVYDIYKNAKKLDDLSTFFLRYWEKYDTSEMVLYEYVNSRLNYSKLLDDYHDAGGHTITVESKDDEITEEGSTSKNKKKKTTIYPGSLNERVGNNTGDNEGSELQDIQRDKSDHYEEFMEQETIDETVLHAITIMLNLEDHLSGKSKNDKSILYKKMFHTEAVSTLCHHGIITDDYPHERELIETLKLTFLDYYTLKKCRLITEIRRSPLKQLFVISEEDPGDTSEAKLPLKQGVIKTYLKKREGMEVSDGAISQQRKKYYEFTKEYISYERSY